MFCADYFLPNSKVVARSGGPLYRRPPLTSAADDCEDAFELMFCCVFGEILSVKRVAEKDVTKTARLRSGIWKSTKTLQTQVPEMFKSISFLTTAVVLSFSSATFADSDDLFSEFSSVSVFGGNSESSGSKKSGNAVPRRVNSSTQLRDLIKTAGFDAKVASTRAVTAEKELEPWTFPVLLVISEDETMINVVLGLTTIKDVAKELPAEKLLKMMTASQKNAPAMFAYHAPRQRTELSVTMKNDNLTGQMLRDEINRMAVLAKKSADVWANDSQKASANPTSPRPTVKQSPAPVELSGKWAASKSATEAFAIEFKANRTFNLVYIKDGQQTKSSGSFTVENGSLTLSGSDGLKLTGDLTVSSDKEFRFKPQNSSVLVFRKA